MPNITVKKHDGTTDVIYTQTQTGGSDAQRPAIWQATTIGVAASHRPEIRYYVRRRNDGATVVLTGHYPTLSLDSSTGITSVIGRQRYKGEFDLDTRYAASDVDEMVSQFINFMSSGTMRTTIKAQALVNS